MMVYNLFDVLLMSYNVQFRFELFRRVAGLECSIRISFFNLCINRIWNYIVDGMNLVPSRADWNSEMLYVAVTNLFSYLVTGIEYKYWINIKILSTKILLMAGINLNFQIGGKYFGDHIPYVLCWDDVHRNLLPFTIK